MKWLIERPGIFACMFVCKLEIYIVINGYFNAVGGPFQSIHMKTGGAIWYHYRCCLLCADHMIIFFAMNGTVNSALIITYMFHNINLTIIGPFQRISRSKHPDRRPASYACGNFCANLNSTIFPVAL